MRRPYSVIKSLSECAARRRFTCTTTRSPTKAPCVRGPIAGGEHAQLVCDVLAQQTIISTTPACATRLRLRLGFGLATGGSGI